MEYLLIIVGLLLGGIIVYGILSIVIIVIFCHYYMAYVNKNMRICDGEANG